LFRFLLNINQRFKNFEAELLQDILAEIDFIAKEEVAWEHH
jgi:hypothetical protein